MDRNAAAGTRGIDPPPSHKLHGRCPDGDLCWFVQSPCSQMCSRLQPRAIAAELQAQVARAKATVTVFKGHR